MYGVDNSDNVLTMNTDDVLMNLDDTRHVDNNNDVLTMDTDDKCTALITVMMINGQHW